MSFPLLASLTSFTFPISKSNNNDNNKNNNNSNIMVVPNKKRISSGYSARRRVMAGENYIVFPIPCFEQRSPRAKYLGFPSLKRSSKFL